MRLARDYVPAVKYGAKWAGNDYLQGPITKGDYWYVDDDISGSGNGKEWSEAFKTITEAVAVAGDDDVIFVAPAQYNEEPATIAITQENLALVAATTGPERAQIRTEIRMHGVLDTNIISANAAHNFELAGFRLTPYNSTTSTGLVVSDTAASYGTYIHDNYFYSPASANTQAIQMGVANSFDCDSMVIENNDFWKGGSANVPMVDWLSATRGIIRGNTFTTIGNNANWIAIDCYDATAPMGQILDNRFLACEGGNCIAINLPTPAVSDWFIDGNVFINYASNNVCFDYSTYNSGINYRGATAITT